MMICLYLALSGCALPGLGSLTGALEASKPLRALSFSPDNVCNTEWVTIQGSGFHSADDRRLSDLIVTVDGRKARIISSQDDELKIVPDSAESDEKIYAGKVVIYHGEKEASPPGELAVKRCRLF